MSLKTRRAVRTIRDLLFVDALALLPKDAVRKSFENAERVASEVEAPDAWFEVACAYHQMHQLSEAIRCYTEVLSRARRGRCKCAADACNNLGAILQEMGNHEKAIECFQLALAEPTYSTPAKAYFNLGNCYTFGLQDHRHAISCYETILKRWPRYERIRDVWGNLGRCHSLLGDREAAEKCYQRSIQARS